MRADRLLSPPDSLFPLCTRNASIAIPLRFEDSSKKRSRGWTPRFLSRGRKSSEKKNRILPAERDGGVRTSSNGNQCRLMHSDQYAIFVRDAYVNVRYIVRHSAQREISLRLLTCLFFYYHLPIVEGKDGLPFFRVFFLSFFFTRWGGPLIRIKNPMNARSTKW